jgi:hypothetical protein
MSSALGEIASAVTLTRREGWRHKKSPQRISRADSQLAMTRFCRRERPFPEDPTAAEPRIAACATGSSEQGRLLSLQDDAAIAFGVDWASNCVNASSAWLAYITEGPAPM